MCLPKQRGGGNRGLMRLMGALLVVALWSVGGQSQEGTESLKKPADKVRFVDKGEYVEDTATGLLWQKDGVVSGKRNFYQAAEYAKGLKVGGLEGWRVPTAKEFAAIFPATDKPFANTKYNPNMCCAGGNFDSYWTSDLDKGEDYAFVYQWYAKGGANNCFASKNFCYVRCVRGAADVAELVPLDAAALTRVKELITQLGAEEFKTRDTASTELKKHGAKIRPLLQAALDATTDAEIKSRLKLLLGI